MNKFNASVVSMVVALAATNALAESIPASSQQPPAMTAGQPAGPGAHMFKENDTNNDGAISKDEWRAKGDKMFSETDTNNDGKLTPEEMKARHEKRRAEWKERREERKGKMGEVRDQLKPTTAPAVSATPAPAAKPLAPTTTH
ncbi:MAG: EF-hand domain-containing protein [Rickettsiales bacterium]